MFLPTNKVRLQITSGETDVYGQPKPGRWVTEDCRILRLLITAEKSAVRADTSASRGAAMELESNCQLQLSPRTAAEIDDILELHGHQFKINGKEPRFDAAGMLDHYQVSANIWRKSK